MARRHVEIEGPDTYEDAVMIANRVERTLASERRQQRPERTNLRMVTLSTEDSSRLAGLQQKKDRLTEEDKQFLKRTGACFRCRKQGHIGRNCPPENFRG
eukprot:Nk52_evm1s1466 gene=Nk52_evmTU1s1466